MDHRLPFDAIAERLHDKVSGEGERERLRREFLAKILQLSVQLPEPSQASVTRDMAQALFKGTSGGPAVAQGMLVRLHPLPREERTSASRTSRPTAYRTHT